jgi:hypothetical protein
LSPLRALSYLVTFFLFTFLFFLGWLGQCPLEFPFSFISICCTFFYYFFLFFYGFSFRVSWLLYRPALLISKLPCFGLSCKKIIPLFVSVGVIPEDAPVSRVRELWASCSSTSTYNTCLLKGVIVDLEDYNLFGVNQLSLVVKSYLWTEGKHRFIAPLKFSFGDGLVATRYQLSSGSPVKLTAMWSWCHDRRSVKLVLSGSSIVPLRGSRELNLRLKVPAKIRVPAGAGWNLNTKEYYFLVGKKGSALFIDPAFISL